MEESLLNPILAQMRTIFTQIVTFLAQNQNNSNFKVIFWAKKVKIWANNVMIWAKNVKMHVNNVPKLPLTQTF